MATAPPLWESEPDPISPPTSHRAVQRRAKYRDRYRNGYPTDILEWLTQNGPDTYAELMDLRRALYARQTTGKYRIKLLGLTLDGEVKVLLSGPTSSVLILSNKSRHFLLRALYRLRKARRWPPIRYRRCRN